MNLVSDQSMERQTESGSIYIGNTEVTNSLDMGRTADILTRENVQLQIENYQLKHQTLELKHENTELRRKHKKDADGFETERKRYERELRYVQNQLDESRNSSLDMVDKHRLQIKQKEEKERALRNELENIKAKLLNYENADIMEIRPRRSKRFKSNVLKECKRCHSVITESNDEKCCFHPEKPIRSPVYASGYKMMFWKCCYQVSRLEPPGCLSFDNHEPAT